MNPVARYGLALGISVEIWTAVVLAAGWYRDPALLQLFSLVIPLEIVLLVLALRETAKAGATYAKQIRNGALVSLIGGSIIFFGSALLTTAVFPNYFSELRDLGAETLARSGKSADEIEAQLKRTESKYNPWSNAMQGFIATVGTGTLTTLVAAIWLRKAKR